MNRHSWLLLTLFDAGPRGLAPAQLQKILFLLAQEIPELLGTQDFYDFIPYNYGPFSKQIYRDAESLAQRGMVNIYWPPGSSYPMYELTPNGFEQARVHERYADRRARQYLRSVVRWAQPLRFSELVSSIYKKYPSFRVNSVFQD
ncbi:MAG: hypothetical protein WAL51_02925 [Candidatus Acidiferrales bacterium]